MVTRIFVLAPIPYPWVVVALCVATTMAVTVASVGFGVLYPFIQEDLEISRAQLGLISAGMVAGGSITSLFVGWVADVIGVRRLQTVSLLAVVVGLSLFSQIQSPVQAVLLAFFIGAAASGSYPSFVKAIMDWVTPRTRGLALGITEASIPVGGIVAAVVFTFMVVIFSWRTSVISLAVVLVISVMVFVTFYRDKPSSYVDRDGRIKLGSRMAMVAKNRDIWLATFHGFAFAGLMSVMVTYLVLFLKESLGMSAVAAGGCLAGSLAGGAVGRIGWGLASDLMLNGRRVGALILLGMLAGVSMALMTWLSSDAPLAVVVALTFVVGATAMGWTGLYGAIVAELVRPGLTGTAVGFSSMFTRMGTLAITPIFGLIVDRTGSYDVGWWMMAGIAGVGTLPMFLMRAQERHQ